MLYGGYEHTVDKKGRVFIPAKFREDLGESFIICRGISGKQCLCIYSFAQWEKLVAKLSDLPMSKSSGIKRFIFDGSFNVEFDTQGRIVIPPSLRDYAGLQSGAHLIGMYSYVELWSSELWSKETDYTAEQALKDAEELSL